ncbi:methyl-accepting chemotaxis protein [Aciduricibacillus chroicocephali]|uniref:Methyl-accepting chemotaxis protein n=1 Tax=Aciduricibacillus chroicocephali TaxID=3054939 RepID=A0ABY9KU20_9BACI|nr:methyl-accepting chemotaxis protein [Bacillaceae bacterium 44XB]
MTVGKKLYTGFFTVIILIALLGWSGISKLGQLNDSTEFVANDKMPALYTVQEIKYILSENFSVISEHIISPNDVIMKQKEEKYQKNKQELDKLLREYGDFITSDKERKIISKLNNDIQSYDNFVHAVFNLSSANQDDKAVKVVTEYQDKITAMTEEMNNLVKLNLQYADQAEELTDTHYKRGIIQSIIFIIIAAVAGIVIAFFITRSITKPLTSATNALGRVSEGDLTIEPLETRNNDETGLLINSLNTMVRDLNGIISSTSASASQVAASAEQLNASSEQSTEANDKLLNLVNQNTNGAESQLNKIQNVSAGLENMVGQIQNINSSSNEMNQSVKVTTEYIQSGISSIDNVVDRIDEIKDSFEHMNMIIQSLNQHSKEIGNILGLITDISDQTNLLALNAAIEASRAGEHGKGFAVVANEVRKLAEESKKSADQIAFMIGDIQSETKKAVISIDEGNVRVQEGISSTVEAKQSFGLIETSISDVSDKVNDVTVSIKDIDNIGNQIAEAIENVREIAESSVTSNRESSEAAEEQLATTEEISSSAQSLSRLSEEMQHVIAQFKVKSE